MRILLSPSSRTVEGKWLKVQLLQIPESGRYFDVTVSAAPLRQRLADRADITRLIRCQAGLHVARIEQVVDIRGQAELEIEFICSRCADEIVATLRIPIRMVLMPRSERSGPDEEDENTGYHNGRVVNLGGIIREQIALQLPHVLLCDPNCKGLCPGCGADLNNAPCTCEKPIDPRLQKLAVLKEKIRR